MKTRTLLTAAALCVASASAFADAVDNQYVLDLYSTGVNVVNGVDQSYSYSTNDYDGRLSSQSGQAALATDGTYPLSGANWMPNDDSSKWITPDALINQGSGSDGFLAGSVWEYTTTFTLDTGTILDSVVINGRWAADNEGISISLNGQDLGFGIANGEDVFMDWVDFNIGSEYGNNYFQDGLNTLTFTVKNSISTAGPSGLRVEINGVAAVPEPSTYAMLGLGLLMIGVLVRRKQQGS